MPKGLNPQTKILPYLHLKNVLIPKILLAPPVAVYHPSPVKTQLLFIRIGKIELLREGKMRERERERVKEQDMDVWNN